MFIILLVSSLALISCIEKEKGQVQVEVKNFAQAKNVGLGVTFFQVLPESVGAFRENLAIVIFLGCV